MPYSLDDFREAGLYEERPGAAYGVTFDGGKAIANLNAPTWVKDLLKTVGGDSYEGDKSRQDSAIITALLNCGLSPADTFATFLQSPRGQDAVNRKNGHSEDYVKRTIQKSVGFIRSKNLVDVDFSTSSYISLPTSTKVSTISFDKVEAETVLWLWKTRIPLGKVTVIAGDPGVGKSAMMIDIISRISRGALFPDGERAPVGNCVIASAEDGLGDTLRPRLEAAEADLSRIYAVRFVVDDDNRVEPLSLVDHLSEIDQMIKETSAKLVLIDPFNAYLPSAKVNTYKDQDIRGVMSVLTEVAQSNSCSIVLIAHLNKKEETSVIYRIGGSIGIIAAARSALIVVKDDANEENRILATVKTNLSRPSQPLSYQLVEAKSSAVRVKWTGVATVGGTMKKRENQPDEATLFLKQVLADGEMPAKQVMKEGRDAGILFTAIRRAKEKMGVHSKKIGDIWFWSLP